MGPAEFELLIGLGGPFVLLVSAYFTGGWLERRHYRAIRSREARWRRLPAITFREVPSDWNVREGMLVTGSVVV